MLNKLSLLTLFWLISASLSAQTEPVNQPEKFNFYEVMEADTTPAALLYHNALTWIKKNSTKISQADSTQGIINAEDEFTVYKEVGVLKKLAGKVSYKADIEVRNNRYRYHFYDFVYHEYGPDRFYKVSATGKKKQLDDAKASGWQKLWDSHRYYTTQKITESITVLKVKIIERPVLIQLPVKKEVKWDN